MGSIHDAAGDAVTAFTLNPTVTQDASLYG
ncbi:hypothetical protein A2U01_0069152, partial [Trifolium medium]|nr:hypothetical protein [Trifolium medium]